MSRMRWGFISDALIMITRPGAPGHADIRIINERGRERTVEIWPGEVLELRIDSFGAVYFVCQRDARKGEDS